MKPLYDSRGQKIPLWDDPRLSPSEKHNAWMVGHIRPEFLRRADDGRIYANLPKVWL